MARKILICPVCGKEIKDTDKRYMFPYEVPYINIYTHYSCRHDFDYEGMTEEKMKKIMEMIYG